MNNSMLVVTAGVFSLVALLYACQGEESIRKAQFYTNGQKLYAQRCQNCHGADGKGLGMLYPPLTDTTFMIKHQDILACIVKFGSSGTMEIHGKKYDGQMPDSKDLTNQDIAYLLTYIGNSFGNEMGWIRTEKVVDDLQRCP